MFPDFSQLEVLGKNLTDFMELVKKELAEIRYAQDKILRILDTQEKMRTFNHRYDECTLTDNGEEL